MHVGKTLLTDAELERSEIVANAAMNRQRNLEGGNSYTQELGFNPMEFLQQRLATRLRVAWLDLCCGTGRALIQAAQICQTQGLTQRVDLVGVDLVPMFDLVSDGIGIPRLEHASLNLWRPMQRFDLVSCVHGLHYLGDKIEIIQRVAQWLNEDGLFVAHLDYANVHLEGLKSARVRVGRDLHRAGFLYQWKRHLLTCHGPTDSKLPYEYLGADSHSRPNYTGQRAVDSYYRRLA
jgi:SAM-dependent methyltransferase